MFLANFFSFPILFGFTIFVEKVNPRKIFHPKETFSFGASFEEDNFILSLIDQDIRMSECSMMILQDRFDNGESVDRILATTAATSSSKTPKATYSIKYTIPPTPEIKKVSSWLHKNVTSDLMSKDYLPVQFKVVVSNYRKLSSQCLIVILMVNDIRPFFIQQIYNMITPVYIPITKKDEDFYIFKTRPELHNSLLLMHELPSRIKFKIAIGSKLHEQIGNGKGGESHTKVSLGIRTVCFFCEPGGNPRLIELPASKDNLPRKDVDYFPDFVWDLNGKLLKVSLPHIRAKVEADPPYEGTSNGRRGTWKYLFEEFLTVKFNFSYNMFSSTGMDGNKGGGGTGLMLKNGTWIGVTGDLISGKATFGIVVANTPLRILYIDWVRDSFYTPGSLTFVTAQPARIYSPAALLWPFNFVMWVCILCSPLLCTIFFYLIFQIMDYLGIGERYPISAQIPFYVSTILEQDVQILPESITLQVFTIFWMFYVMVLTNVYRSIMVTLLAFPVLGTLPQTFEELAFSDYEVGFMKHGDSAYNTLAASTDPVYVKLVKEMEIIKGVGLKCLEKVVTEEKYACIAYDIALVHLRERNFSETDTRKLVFAPAKTYNAWLGMCTEGKSIYRINFGKWMSYTEPQHLPDIWDKMDMYDNVRKLKLEWWRKTNQTHKMRHVEEEMDNLTLKNVMGAFYILFLCLAISSLVFIKEFLTFHRTTVVYSVVRGWYRTKYKISRVIRKFNRATVKRKNLRIKK